MPQLLTWNTVAPDRWTIGYREQNISYLIYRVTHLPDFSEPRFQILSTDVDARPAEVAKQQMAMVRGLHSLGEDAGVSLRLVKDGNSITLYLVFRLPDDTVSPENAAHGTEWADSAARFAQGRSAGAAKAIPASDAPLSGAALRIDSALVKNLYTFERVRSSDQGPALDVSWAQEAVEITKDEQEYEGDLYPNNQRQVFYVPYSYLATDNTMENICSALMAHPGRAAVEVTFVPADYLDDEKLWMNENISRLKDCMNGETLRSRENGRILWQGRKLPILKTPLDNCEKENKQLESGRSYLTSLRVFAERDAAQLADAFISNSTRSRGETLLFRRGSREFQFLTSCYSIVDVSAFLRSRYWISNSRSAPYRAQRLNRLLSLEEIINFFRLPIPIRPGFPGFGYDTGLGAPSRSSGKGRAQIRLGTYADIAGGTGDTPAAFDRGQLAKHGLIVGVPGSGKTTAMFNLLDQLWNLPDGQRIPFIVLEPAKTEYRALKNLPEFREDMLVFTLGDEGTSPFRFNPMEVLPGIRLENHISKLQACFVGAFNLFDPLPIFLEQAIRRTYAEKGWYEDSRGGDPGVETPTLADLCRNAEYIVANSGFDPKTRGDFQASLLERLNSLRRGSKGRMLDTPKSVPAEELMGRPVILELDSLNGDEKALMMMFLLSYVFEYCKARRHSGSPLSHMLIVEEAHNLIPSSGVRNETRADPKAHTIELFVNMLAEMRALGQGILIADQLPTAIAQQAVKQTNVKILMRVTAKDDREEIGSTMDLNEEQMHQVVGFKTGHAYLYHEGEDRVRLIRMVNFKADHDVETPPTDEELHDMMAPYEAARRDLFMPYPECPGNCAVCDRRVRSQAESFVREFLRHDEEAYRRAFPGEDRGMLERFMGSIGRCSIFMKLTREERERLEARYGSVGPAFGTCVYTHLLHLYDLPRRSCPLRGKSCACEGQKWAEYMEKM